MPLRQSSILKSFGGADATRRRSFGDHFFAVHTSHRLPDSGRDAILNHANLEKADFYGADLSGASLVKTKLNKIKLDSAILIDTDLSDAIIM